ncbi:hypothetical protein [Parvularcula maris]|uniref:Cupin n=1 Tax=Parvularcula maris TaxID=2965077 RepID=A0A9X2RIC8_9PROT|nr:hypothetical protein [Parvularcula maris]MCQ8185849.1 hypothetical protein [Parvularcula maris]
MTLTELVERYGLEPHPFEGYFIHDEDGYFQALGALDEAHWHKIEASVTYALVEGGPAVVTFSADGRTAKAVRLSSPKHGITVPAGAARTLSCLGQAVLLHVAADSDAAARYLMPDDWFPHE